MSSLLRKRFDASKCKTLLQLTLQRLKVLRNKQALAVKKARVDVAKLLEKGQDSNAKMQVETVSREEKTVVLYDLLDQFCQLVINRLESIKSQKECPSDLREAVASLIFAAPKCANLEELKQVSKHLTYKYGTEFSVAAKELRPDCGVNRQIIQSLSSRPSDFDERLKLLKEIAVENNINWDYEMLTADVSKGATDLIDGPNHFSSATELSQVDTYAVADKHMSRSMHVHDVKGQGTAVLQNAIGSRTMSAAISLGSPLHEVHQFAKTNTNTGIMGFSRAQKDGSEGVANYPVLDPYALARVEGKMDYKVVSDYMGRAQSMDLKQESLGNVAYGKSMTERGQGHNVLLDASHREDAPQKSKGKKAKKRLDTMEACTRNEEELLELKNAAEHAFASATQATEAARAAVAMVHMESLERSKGRKAVNIYKVQETQSESSSVWDESHKLAGMDFKHSADRQRLFYEDEFEIKPSQNNGMASDEVSATNTHSTSDAIEDSFKYVVFEQTSGSQKNTQSSTQAARYSQNAETYEFPEVWSEPTLYSHKNADKIIFDAEPEDSVINEVPNFYINNMEQELDKESSLRDNDHHTEVHQDKYVENEVPQFDDSSSEEEDDCLPKDLSMPHVDDHNSEEANEEEEPFYLRGRAAKATEEYANGTTRAPWSKASILMSTVSFSIDDQVEEESSMKKQSSDQEASLHHGLNVEPLGVSNDKVKPFIAENSSSQYSKANEASQKLILDDHEEPVSFPTRSSKTPIRQINTDSTSESSIMSPVAYSDSSGKPTTPRKPKWMSSTTEERDLDPSYYKMASPLASVKLPSLNENRDPSSRVNRKPNWFSGASEDSESMSERSFESHKLGWNPSSLEDLNLESPKPSFDFEALTKINHAQVTQPSAQKSYYGVSKRSVRSSRSRQNSEVPSPSSGNEDIRSSWMGDEISHNYK